VILNESDSTNSLLLSSIVGVGAAGTMMSGNDMGMMDGGHGGMMGDRGGHMMNDNDMHAMHEECEEHMEEHCGDMSYEECEEMHEECEEHMDEHDDHEEHGCPMMRERIKKELEVFPMDKKLMARKQ
jgi:hypothetical protein